MKFKIIRGKRLLQQLICEASYSVLDSNTRNKMPATDRRENIAHKQRVANLLLTPSLPSQILDIKGTVQGERNTYNVHLQFDKVRYSEQPETETVEIQGTDSQPYYIFPIQLATNNVKVFCNCLDFRWRFAIANSKNNSLYGNIPPPYVKKTNRPPVNPQDVPGVCKHLIKTVEVLKESGLLV